MVKKSWSLGGAAVLLVALLAVLAAPSLLRAKLRACVPFHLFAIPLVAAVIAHAYLGTVANPGTWSAMVTGKVSRLWAKKHHSEWYKEVAGEEGPEKAE
jgi:formate dehydrogenase subunit gamma